MSESPYAIENGQSAGALYPFISIYSGYLKLFSWLFDWLSS